MYFILKHPIDDSQQKLDVFGNIIRYSNYQNG